MKKLNKAKLSAILIVLILLIFILTAAVKDIEAAEGLKLEISELKSIQGEQVVIIVSADNAAGTGGGQFIFKYDHALLRPVAIDPGELVTEATSALNMANLEYADGQLMFMWVTAAADTADSGVICEIVFDILKTGRTSLEFDDIVIAPDDIEEVTTSPKILSITDVGVELEEYEKVMHETVTDTTSYSWLIGLVVLAVLAAAGLVVFKRLRNPGAKH